VWQISMSQFRGAFHVVHDNALTQQAGLFNALYN
jgi:hypothetical protein